MRTTLRKTFEEAPELYDRVRPSYPEALFDDLASLAGLQRGSRVLELGCGTGQATLPLARRGYEVVAVELGPGLADLARRKLAGFGAVTVEQAAFEEWPLPPERFDAVLAATSFHWIDPDIRLVKTARALRPGGALAVVSTHHVAGGSEAFFDEVQHCYERLMPGTPAGLTLPAPADVPAGHEELESDGRFQHGVSRRHEVELTYSTREYLAVLQSYSSHRELAPDRRQALLDCVARLIDDRHGGRIAKRYLFELAVAYAAG